MTMDPDFVVRPPADIWFGRLQAFGQVVFICALMSAILPFGAVSAISVTVAFLVTVAAAGIGSLKPPSDRRVRSSYSLALLTSVVLAVYLLAQAWASFGNPFAHPIWAVAQSYIGPLPGAISVDPSTTLTAIVPLVTPFLLYSAALALFPSDEMAFRLLGILGAIGTGFALFGLLQVSLLPRSLLFTEKVAYLDSLTSIFVNRNTAGTFLGIAALACLALLMRMERQVSGSRALLRLMTDPSFSSGRRFRAIMLASCVAVCLLALLLTRSRGAALATAAAFLFILPLLFQDKGRSAPTKGGLPGRRSRRRLLLGFGLAALAVGGVVLIFGGQFILRLETRGVDVSRLCVYAATIEAYRDNWLFGTGFGTFESVFPSYRDFDCGSPYLVFRRAHNVFLEGLLGLGIAFVPLALLVYGHLGAVFVNGLRSRRRLRFVPVIALGAIGLVTLHSLVDFSVQIPGMAAYLAAFLGACATISLGRPSGAKRSRMDRRYSGRS